MTASLQARTRRTASTSRTITDAILAHYDANARDLPWRVPPAESRDGALPDPYHVWLSEVMLQQTTVATVRRYFAKFTRRWPTVGALAAASEGDVMGAWAGLGYYARARNLIACAAEVAACGGRFPETESALLELPGIGPYTAAAIAAFAFGERAVVVDANIERVVARLFAIDTPLPAAKPAIRAAMDDLTPTRRAGDFAQGCMDLGARICTPRRPRCELCPVVARCLAAASGRQEELPVKPVRKAKPQRRARIFWIERDGEVMLVRRPSGGMLGGMRALPSDDWCAARDGDGAPPVDGSWTVHEAVARHVFSHFALSVDLAVLRGDSSGEPAIADSSWWPIDRLDEAGLPTLFAKVVRYMAKERE